MILSGVTLRKLSNISSLAYLTSKNCTMVCLLVAMIFVHDNRGFFTNIEKSLPGYLWLFYNLEWKGGTCSIFY